MKFRADFVTNSSSTGYVVITVTMKDGCEIRVEQSYDSGYGGYVWNNNTKDFDKGFKAAKTGEDVLKVMRKYVDDFDEFMLEGTEGDLFRKSIEAIDDVALIDSIHMTEKTHNIDRDDSIDYKYKFANKNSDAKKLWEYEIKEDGVYIIGCKKVGKSVSVPENIENKPVVSIGDEVFYGKEGLVNVTIPSSVRRIGNAAFWGCTKLAGVTMPRSVTSIGKEAFADCDALSEVILSENLTDIPDYSFCRCKSLNTIRIPKSVVSVSEKAFLGSGLEKILLPHHLYNKIGGISGVNQFVYR